MEIKTVGVIGAGQMGSGHCQVAAAKGFSVIMTTSRTSSCKRGSRPYPRAWIASSRKAP